MPELEATELMFSFEVNGIASDKFALIRMEGREAISELYRFDVDLVSADPDIDPEKVVNQPALVVIDRDGDITRFHGIITIFEQREMGPEFVNYHAVIVPRVHNLTFTKQCQIFQEKPVKTIISDVLKENGLSEGKDFDISLKETYPTREYTVQYQESDLNFIMRLMEHDGIFFFFEHGEKQEKMIISDKKEAHKPVQGDDTIPFRDARAINPTGEAVGALIYRAQQLSKQVVLKDYNYRKPDLDVKGSAEVVDKGFGTYIEYGDHFKDPEDGSRLARMRAEEQSCRNKLYFGESACRHFRSGGTFKLIDHYRNANNMKYLLTEVIHSGTQLGVIGSAYGGSPEKPAYTNSFTAIPADVAFRPARVTPKPLITGIMHATVDADASGEYAEIDEMGRYKVKLPWDLSDAGAGKASRFIRMSQPYSGSEYGMHFPLHKDTEVLLVHLDGDPDRPIIAGTVPNPNNASPVTGANKTQCRIRTGSDNEMLIEDTKGSEYILVRTPNQDTHLSLGADHHSNHAPPGITMGSQFGVSINAGKGVTISAGSPNHDEGISTQGATSSKVAGVAATVAGAAALAGGVGADLFASGLAKALPALAGDIGGFIAGVSLPGVYVTAPGKTGITAGGEVVIGAIGSADMVALGPANVLSVAGAMLAGVKGAAVIAVGKVEMISAMSDVLIEAKKRGNVIVEAKKNVHVEAHKEDIKLETKTRNVIIEAQKDFFLSTGKGKGEVLIEKDLHVESITDKKITLKAGKSTIVMTDEKITIHADLIELISNDKNGKLGVGKCGLGDAINVESKTHLRLYSQNGTVLVSEKGFVVLNAKKEMKVFTKEFNATGAKKCIWPQHDDSA